MSQPNLIQLIKEHWSGKIPLKEDTCQNKPCFILSGFAFPKQTVTPFKIYNKVDEYYTLESILYLLANKEANHSEYVKRTAIAQIRAITRVDKRDIVEYLSGSKTDLPSNYDQNIPPAIPISFERIRIQEGEPVAKKIKLEPRLENEETATKKSEITICIKKESSMEEDVPLRQLNDDLTVDKIAELKRKKNLTQKKRIAPVREVIDVDELLNYEIEDTGIFKTSLSLNVYVTRDNCMEAQTADFSKILDVIESIRITESNQLVIKKSGYLPARNDVKPSSAPGVQRYDRYDQKPALIDESLIISDGISTFIGKSIPAAIAASQNAVKKPAPRTLLPPGPPPKKRASKIPIIIVPPSGGMSGTLINKNNVKDILQDMNYCSLEEKKNMTRRESAEIQIHRRKGGMIVPYKIVENATNLSSEQWDRVVAIFVMGPAWQFKGWKWNGNPVDIFSQIPAFHLYYDDLEIDKNVAKWNVTAIPISRSKRHLDKARLAKIWDIVDRYIVKHKNHLRG